MKNNIAHVIGRTGVILSAIFFLIGIGFACSVFADVIILKSGETIEGKLLDKAGEYMRVETAEGVRAFGLKDIQKVRTEEFKPHSGEVQAIADDEADIVILKTGETIKGRVIYDLEAGEYMGEYMRVETAEGVRAFSLEDVEKVRIRKKKGQDIAAGEKESVDQSETYLEKGLVHSLAGESEEALRNYQEALRSNPNLAQEYLDRGVAEYYLDNHGAAEGNLLKAQELFEASGDLQRLQITEEYLKKLFE